MCWKPIAVTMLLLVNASTSAENTSALVDNAKLVALIECRARHSDISELMPLPTTTEQAVARQWTQTGGNNIFMTEFILSQPIEVFGHSSSHIAFAGNAVMAILDLPDPRSLAHELQLEAALDTSNKVLYGRELYSVEVEPSADGTRWVESLVLNVSNVSSHPDKTLVGCSYSLDML